MTKTCAVAGCKTNYKKQENGVKIISNPGTVIGFPDESKPSTLLPEWIRFCNQKSIHITEHVGICTKHFDDKFVKEGKRKTLRWELHPIPTKYCPDIEVPPSLMPTSRPWVHQRKQLALFMIDRKNYLLRENDLVTQD